MKEKILLKSLSYLGFLTSAVLTYLSYINGGVSIQEKILSACMTVVTQGGSFIFFHLAVTNKKRFYWLLAIGLFTLSIYSTADYQAKRQDTSIKEMFSTSDEFQESKIKKELALENRKIALGNKEMLRQGIEDKKNDIKETTKLYKDRIASLEGQIKKTRADWRKEQIDSEIRKVTKEMNSVITGKEEQLKTQIREAQSISTSVNLDKYDVSEETKEKMINNSLGIVGRLKEWMGWNEVVTSFIIQLIFAILFEMTAVGLHVASQDELREEFKNIKKTFTYAKKPPITQKTTQETTQLSQDEKVTNAEINKYRKVMLETAKGDKAIGYKKIIQLAGLTDYQGKEIMKKLREKGEITIAGNQTKINKKKGVLLEKQ